MNVGSLFSGIGGLDLGLERAGMTVRWQVENNPYCTRVLAKHWPTVPNYGDITKIDWEGIEGVDLICGGFPCQPASVAGRRQGTSDTRWLWPEFARAVREIRPTFVVVENVPGLRSRGLDQVLGDLHALGYDAEWDRIYASWFGAYHRRSRLFVVAYCHGKLSREQSWRSQWSDREDPLVLTGDREARPLAGWASRPRLLEPRMARSLHGIPDRMDRTRWKALGNAVVPQVAEWIGRQLMETYGRD